LGVPNKPTPGDTRKTKLPENFVIGPLTKELHLYSDGITGFIAVRFHPWGFSAFSAQPATALVDAILPAARALYADIRPLEQQLLNNPSREKKLQVLTAWFTNTPPRQSPDLPAIEAIATALRTQHGTQKITDLARQFNINPRKLERHFLQHIGLPAKRFARILRFNHAKNLIQKNPDIPLAELAYETGYADQAHFSKNFRQLFDCSPAQFKTRIKKFLADTSGLDKDVVFIQD
ncbi:MAG TPA: helix-turn-helix domain-containing protein, partial [Puia sp.]|nr:helix-turn-helix domain-containing protein [Puia sp.]